VDSYLLALLGNTMPGKTVPSSPGEVASTSSLGGVVTRDGSKVPLIPPNGRLDSWGQIRIHEDPDKRGDGGREQSLQAKDEEPSTPRVHKIAYRSASLLLKAQTTSSPENGTSSSPHVSPLPTQALRVRIAERSEEPAFGSPNAVLPSPGHYFLNNENHILPSTRNPQPSPYNPQPSSLKPQASTLNPKPYTLNPKIFALQLRTKKHKPSILDP